MLEAAALQRVGHLQERAVEGLAEAARRQAGRDPGVGPGEVRTEIQRALKDIHKNSASIRQLRHLVDAQTPGYLDNWHDKWSSAGDPPELEFTSRSLAGHLLDLGLSPEHLYRWLQAIAGAGKAPSVPELIDEARTLAARTPHLYEVLIPVSTMPKKRQAMPSNWLEREAAAKWIRDQGVGDGSGVEQNGGFTIEVTARDPWRAVEIASDIAQGLASRTVVGLPGEGEMRVHEVAIVRGTSRVFPLARPRRQVEVHAISRQGVLYDSSDPRLMGRLRTAIDLLVPLEVGAPESAVSGGWAAVEAVLKRQDAPNVQAAHDLGALVACSFPRAELTSLSCAYAASHPGDALTTALEECTSNRERCNLLQTAIGTHSHADFTEPSDAAAAGRIEDVLGRPSEVLSRVRDYATETFGRLYRQRNLVLHAGKGDSVAMLSTLRCAPPLIGAAFDRIVHAALQDPSVEAEDLVARAEVSLRLAGTNSRRNLADLLEASDR